MVENERLVLIFRDRQTHLKNIGNPLKNAPKYKSARAHNPFMGMATLAITIPKSDRQYV